MQANPAYEALETIIPCAQAHSQVRTSTTVIYWNRVV